MCTHFVRPSSLLFLFLGFTSAASAAQISLSGVVADSTGQPLPRAFVSVKSDDRVVATTFADDRGAFRIHGDVAGKCSVEASLTGFKTAATACSTDPLRLTLAVAPIQESIVVTATRGETPSGSAGLERHRIRPSGSRAPAIASGCRSASHRRRHHRRPQRWLRKRDVALRARRREQLHQGSAGWHSAERTGRHVQLQQRHVGASRTGRARPRRPVGALRVGRNGRRPSDVLRACPGQRHARGHDGRRWIVRHRARVDQRGGRQQESSTIRSARRNIVTDNDVPNNDFDNTTLSATAGVQLAPATMLRFVARTEFGQVGVPGATAYGRPDLDAFFDRHDGVVGATFSQEINAALQHRATYALSFTDYDSTNLVEDPPYTPAVRRQLGAFEFCDFPYDLNTDERRHHAAYQADWRVGGRGTHLITAAFDWDGERATLTDRLGGIRGQGEPRQLRRHASAPGAVGPHVSDAWAASRTQRQLRRSGRSAAVARLHPPAGERRVRSNEGEDGVRGWHQGTDDRPVVQPEPVLARQPRSRTGTIAELRDRRRAASRRRSGQGRTDVFLQPVQEHHLDQDDQFHALHVAVLQHRPDPCPGYGAHIRRGARVHRSAPMSATRSSRPRFSRARRRRIRCSPKANGCSDVLAIPGLPRSCGHGAR